MIAALHAIYLAYALEAAKPSPDFNSLQLKASKIVRTWKPPYNDDEVVSYVEVMRVAVPVDPGRSYLDNTAAFLKANRRQVEATIRTLPAREQTTLLEAVDIEIRAYDGAGQDQ